MYSCGKKDTLTIKWGQFERVKPISKMLPVLQLWLFANERLLNKPYENEVTLGEKNNIFKMLPAS